MSRKRSEGVRKDETTSKPRKAGKPTSSQKDASVPETMVLFPIVGIGASAGVLDAFEKFFTDMPPDTGMAFVLVQHLDPIRKSILSELIKRYTRMKVLEAEDGMLVEPNSVFVIPLNRYTGILRGKLHLLEPTALPGQALSGVVEKTTDKGRRNGISSCKEMACSCGVSVSLEPRLPCCVRARHNREDRS